MILNWPHENALLVADGFQWLGAGPLTSIALAGLGYLALQAGLLRSRRLMIFGMTLLIAAGALATFGFAISLETSLLLALGGIAIGGGVAFITLREPVHAALGFATVILSTCGLFFLMEAAFLGAAMLIVYAGAIIIVFMFVLMFAQGSRLTTADLQLTAPIPAAILGASLLALLLSVQLAPGAVPPPVPESVSSQSSGLSDPNRDRVAELGRAMYTDYLWSVEIAGTLLLLATVGAIAIAQIRVGENE